jgi:hypothetical protein
MHGGASTGPKTADGLARIRTARTKHGRYSSEMAQMRWACAELRRLAREILNEV